MRKQMFFPNEKTKVEGVISTDKPVDYDRNKKVSLSRKLEESEYEEVVEFLKSQNLMASGNYTLLTRGEIEKYKRLNCYSVLMRNETNKLFGTIFSIPFPVKCSITSGTTEDGEYTKDKIIVHGCTTFLNVSSKIRGFKMCMLLIRELTQYGYENNIFSGYQLTSFPLTEKSVAISNWYRPINMMKSLLLGFTFPGYNEVSNFNKNRMLYKCKAPKNYLVNRVKAKGLEEALSFYGKINENNRFVFFPDLSLFEKWTREYLTYTVKFEDETIGIFSIGTINCKMGNMVEGTMCLPLLFNSKKGKGEKVLRCLLSVAEEKGYDLLYGNQIGDLTQQLYESVNSIRTDKKSFFSLYNNNMNLKPSDLYVPVF
jgi:hypothetical protein